MENLIDEQPTIVSEIKSVEKGGGYFSMQLENGWGIALAADNPGGVVPTAGQSIEQFGRGIGYPVRGMRIDGKVAYYRTEVEDNLYRSQQTYGRDAEELLSRWDEGDTVWSIEMGGLGPGYEQALQIAAFEVLRAMLRDGEEFNTDSLNDNARMNALGLSGSQFGAAVSLARSFKNDGPIAVHEKFSDRAILISANPPTLQGIDAAIAKASSEPA